MSDRTKDEQMCPTCGQPVIVRDPPTVCSNPIHFTSKKLTRYTPHLNGTAFMGMLKQNETHPEMFGPDYDWTQGPYVLASEADAAIERLTRERDEARAHTSTAAFMRIEAERDEWAAKWHRVRAELAELKYPGMKGVVRPLSSEPSSDETAAKPTDSELYSSSELFRHIWVCPMGWIGDKLIYGPGYTSADMKPWLVKLRHLVGFEHPKGTPLEQPEKASSEPSSGSGCPACGVMYVSGARHFSGCPLHPGESVQNGNEVQS